MKKKSFLKTIILIFFLSMNFGVFNYSYCYDQKNLDKKIFCKNNISLAPMVEEVMPAVVRVFTRYHNICYGNFSKISQKNVDFSKSHQIFFSKRYESIVYNHSLLKISKNYTLNNVFGTKLGSGVIVDSKNFYVITNYHVVSHYSKISIVLTNGEKHHAIVVGKDKKRDIALLKILDVKNLKSIKIANSDSVKVGDYSIAIGSPFNLKNSVSFGIISALGRASSKNQFYQDYLQTDASINSGNSGGPLLNPKGELIGINTSMLTYSSHSGNIGIGFAIPSNIITKFISQVKLHGKWNIGNLGISFSNLKKIFIKELGLPKNIHGVLINKIKKKYPAEKYGLQRGDIITYVNGFQILNTDSLMYLLKHSSEDDIFQIQIYRNNKFIFLKIPLQHYLYNDFPAVLFHYKLQGSYIEKYDQEKYRKSHELYEDDVYVPNVQGILINYVRNNSFSDRIGLKENDIIVSVNGKKVSDINNFKNALSLHKNIILVEIIRHETKIFRVIY